MTKDDRKRILKTVGRAAARWRRAHGLYQITIAEQLGMCFSNISAFERGENDSALILEWYILNGFDPMEEPEIWQLLQN